MAEQIICHHCGPVAPGVKCFRLAFESEEAADRIVCEACANKFYEVVGHSGKVN